MKKIILDTNFLIDCAKFRIDFISELKRICDFKYQMFIVDKTIDELARVKDKINAKIAQQFIDKFNIPTIATKKDKIVDKLILDIVDKDYIIATQDKNLKKELNQKGILIVFIRNKNYLSF